MQSKGVINNMFSFIWTQPIYKTLRQMKIAPMILLGVSVDIMYRLLAILESANALSPAESMAAVGALMAAIFGVVWKSIHDLSIPYKSDD